MDMNSVFLVGRLAEPVRYHPANPNTGVSARATGLLMVNRMPNNNGGQNVDAIPFVAWGAHADNLATYTDSGKELGITGELRVNSFFSRRPGEGRKSRTEVYVLKVSYGRDSNRVKLAKAGLTAGQALDPQTLLTQAPGLLEALQAAFQAQPAQAAQAAPKQPVPAPVSGDPFPQG